jgi:hypothetical protein
MAAFPRLPATATHLTNSPLMPNPQKSDLSNFGKFSGTSPQISGTE